jgi:hypothetical protein
MTSFPVAPAPVAPLAPLAFAFGARTAMPYKERKPKNVVHANAAYPREWKCKCFSCSDHPPFDSKSLLDQHLKLVHWDLALIHPENMCQLGSDCPHQKGSAESGTTSCRFNHVEIIPFYMKDGPPDGSDWCDYELRWGRTWVCTDRFCHKNHAQGYGHRMALQQDVHKAKLAARAATHASAGEGHDAHKKPVPFDFSCPWALDALAAKAAARAAHASAGAHTSAGHAHGEGHDSDGHAPDADDDAAPDAGHDEGAD